MCIRWGGSERNKSKKLLNGKEKHSLQQKASITAESAVVLPFFFLAAVILISILDLFRIHSILLTSLTESAEELGMYAYCTEDLQKSPVGAVTDAVCIAYAALDMTERLRAEPLLGIVGGRKGISLLGSRYENGIVSLRADYIYKSPVMLFPIWPRHIRTKSRARAWIGYDKDQNLETENAKENMVYITNNESVHHLYSDCSHIDLTVERTSAGKVSALQNAYGEKYQACEKCWKGQEGSSVVYVSKKGTCYHSDSHCAGLTRYVKLIRESQTKTSLCQRCGQKEEK